jgi:hypothetical protein
MSIVQLESSERILHAPLMTYLPAGRQAFSKEDYGDFSDFSMDFVSV